MTKQHAEHRATRETYWNERCALANGLEHPCSVANYTAGILRA